jgi:F-type H+-transporting ATPase subunit b
MRWRGRIGLVAARCFFALLLPISYAGAAEPAAANPAETSLGEMFRWLNFSVVALALGYLIVKYGPGFFRARATAISADMTRAAAAKAEAERMLHEAEEKLARLNQEVAGLRSAAERDAVAAAERVGTLTRSDMEKIVRAARAEIDAAERAGRLQLKAVAARAAIDRAEALLEKQLTPELQSALFHQFVESLPGSAN